jgi:hypothetical protein
MMNNLQHRADFDAVLAEHRRLHELVEQIEATLSRPHPSHSSLSRLLETLSESLRGHFEHEERGGYLSEALSAAPQWSALAVRLLDEHAGFLISAERMRRGVNVAAATGDWSDLANAFADFERRFDEHETAENRLVQDAMLRDLEAED